MKITFEIDTENDAFYEDMLIELRRAIGSGLVHLEAIARSTFYSTYPIYDTNGNKVGLMRVEK